MKKLIIFFIVIVCSLTAFSKKWGASIPKEFDENELWIHLTEEMKKANMNYGVVAGAERILNYYSDLKSKEFAYKIIIEMIDFGYPYSLRSVFMSGDLELVGPEKFYQSYNLYKASIDLDKNMHKWAENYFNRIDRENFPKYLFYQALIDFNNKKLDEALKKLDKALMGLKESSDRSLSKKASRTMARIYYEQKKYSEAFDIYKNYLLKINPTEMQDWLEAAWCLYRLGRLEEALGYLYNLESLSFTHNEVYLEKYIIRGIIYREKCASKNTRFLYHAFEKEFATTINKIKMGEPLPTLEKLKMIVEANSDYLRTQVVYNNLLEEQKRIRELPRKVRRVAEFLYETELKNRVIRKRLHEEETLSEAARRLVIMGESLRFLQFEVIRERYNPDKVFMPPPPPLDGKIVEELKDGHFLLHWMQWGDYWLDERLDYRAIIKSRCD